MSPLHYAFVVIVALVFAVKLGYHILHEIPRDRELIEQRRHHRDR